MHGAFESCFSFEPFDVPEYVIKRHPKPQISAFISLQLIFINKYLLSATVWMILGGNNLKLKL